ncbi:hypothetical protein MCY_01305, partial [Bartonella rattimassiliensis 15908]
MRKIYATPTRNDVNFLRSFSAIREISFIAMAVFLANISPVFSASPIFSVNPNFNNRFLGGVKSVGVFYPQSTISVAGLNVSEDDENFLTKALWSMDNNSIINVLTKDDNKLLRNALSIEDQYKRSFISPQRVVRDNFTAQQLAQNDANIGATGVINVSDFSQNFPVVEMPRSSRIKRSSFADWTREDFEKRASVVQGTWVGTEAPFRSVILGYGINIKADEGGVNKAVVIGYQAGAGSGWSVVVGANARAEYSGYGSVVMGRKAYSSGLFGISVGGFGKPDGNDSPKPYGTVVKGNYSIGIGYEAYVEEGASDSIAIGRNAKVLGNSGVALGGSASVELGASNAITLGWKATVHSNANSSIALGDSANVSLGSKNSIALGQSAYVEAASDSTISIGLEALTGAKHTIAIGSNALAKSNYGVAIGNEALASYPNTLAFGAFAVAKELDAVVLGYSAKALSKAGIALGSFSLANVGPAIVGYDPMTRKNLDKQSMAWKSSLGALSIGNSEKGITRQIVGVSAGTNDTDAVNVAQVKSLQ